MTKNGVTTYYHSTVAEAIVRPGNTPVMAEMIRQWGRDCGGEEVGTEPGGSIPVAETDAFWG